MMIQLNDDQEKLVQKAVHWFHNSSEQVFQYSGAAGTGKSVVMNAIIERLRLSMAEVAPMSYIGAATIIMRLKGLENAKTIHSWLYEMKAVDTGEIDFYLNKPKKKMIFVPKELPPGKQLICIDEAGCVPYSLKHEIESRGIKVLACGDLNQLPPVADTPAYLYNGKVHYLTQIMRQREDSAIIYLAHKALREEPIDTGLYGNVWVLYEDQLTDAMLADAEVVICGKNATREKYNSRIRTGILGINPRDLLPHYGEKVVCRKNNWSIESNGVNLVNGLIGTVISAPDPTSYNSSDKTFTMDFLPSLTDAPFYSLQCDYEYFIGDPKERQAIKSNPYRTGEKFEFAYSITTHISQGAQYRHGIYIEEWLNRDFNKNLNYTGLTRFTDTCFYIKPRPRFF